MSSFLRGAFSAAGEEEEEPTLPIVQDARTPPKRRTQPSYLATPVTTSASLGSRYRLPPVDSANGPVDLALHTPKRALQRGALLEHPSVYDRPAGRKTYSSLLTPDSTPEHGGQARDPRTIGTLAPVTPSKSRNPSTSRSSLQPTTGYLTTPPPSNRKRAPGSSTAEKGAESTAPPFSDFDSIVAIINRRSTGRTTAKTESQGSGSATPDIQPRYLLTPTTAGRPSAKATAKREINNVLNTPSGAKFSAPKGAFLSDILGFRVNKDGTICDTEEDDGDADGNDDRLLNSRSPFVFLGHTGIFSTGQTLKPYQALDLKLLIAREQGKPVICDSKTTEIKNTIGSILAYPMGYGKTVVSIALILANPPGKDFAKIETGCPANLIAVPHQGLIKQWRAELKAFSPTLRSLEFSTSLEVSSLQATDVVLITFTQLAIQFGKYQKFPQAANTLFSVRWYRFIADESHQFRNPNTQSAKTAWGVTKTHGLCLTGTPVQNSVRDFYPLYRFLEVEYEGIIDINVFYSKVYGKSYKGPILPGGPTRIYETLKKNFCIFRDPIDPITREPILSLAVRKDTNVKIWPSTLEVQLYETIDGLKLHPLAKTTRLRQACAHPSLLNQFLDPNPDGSAMAKRQNRKKDEVPDSLLQLPSIDAQEISSRFKKLLYEHYMSSKLKKMLETLAEHSKDEKAILFINFTSVIPSVEHALRSKNIGYTKYTGGMSDGLREASLKKIANDPKCRVLIISIQAGSLGLHIVACNIVMILEPWWNPYRDDQAVSRIHRIGQTKPVHVYRFVTMNTIESHSLWKTQIQKRSNLIDVYGEYHYGEEVDYIADSGCRSA